MPTFNSIPAFPPTKEGVPNNSLLSMNERELGERTLRAFKRKQHEDSVLYLSLLQTDPKRLRAGYTIRGQFSSIGANLLHLSALNGWIGLTKDLITRYSFDPQEKDSWDRTPLHYAVVGDHTNVLQYLLKSQQNLVLQASDGCKENRPLHYAAEYGSLNAMKYLINDCKCNPHSRNAHGNTCLHHAWAHIDTVKYLVEEIGSNPMQGGHKGKNLFHLAAENGSVEVVSYLLAECQIEFGCADRNGMTGLQLALQYKQTIVVDYLNDWQDYSSRMLTRKEQNNGA